MAFGDVISEINPSPACGSGAPSGEKGAVDGVLFEMDTSGARIRLSVGGRTQSKLVDALRVDRDMEAPFRAGDMEAGRRLLASRRAVGF